jgi:(2Fe-2S) ferredoxin
VQNAPIHSSKMHQSIVADCTNALVQSASMDSSKMHLPIPKTNPKTTKETTQPLVEVEKEIKAYFNLEEKDIEKVANVHLATGKEISYLVEKLKFVKNSPNTRDVVGYLISALKNDYKPIINTYKAFIPQVKTRFHNINQSFDKYDPDELERILKESQKGKFN